MLNIMSNKEQSCNPVTLIREVRMLQEFLERAWTGNWGEQRRPVEEVNDV